MEESVNTKNKSPFIFGVKDGLPIGLGYFPVAFAFGVRASILGIPVFITALISMLNLTSAGQLAGLEVIYACGTFIELIVTQLVINSRYFLMSIGLSQKTDESFNLKNRIFCSAFITDEIFAVTMAHSDNFSAKYFYGVALLPFLGWSLGTVFGAVAGNILPDIITNALGIALYAMFIAIVIPPSISNPKLVFAIVLASALSCVIYFIPLFSEISGGIAVIISAFVSSLIAAAVFPVEEEKEIQDV